jgi:hypothetical protein
VQDGGDDHPGSRDDDDPADDRVEACEQLGTVIREDVHGSHPSGDHCRVEKRVDQVQVGQRRVAQHANHDPQDQCSEDDETVPENSNGELSP